MHREDKQVTTRRVNMLVMGFIHAEIENLRPEAKSGDTSFFNTQMVYTTIGHTIAREIINSRNHRFILKSAFGDVSMTIDMGNKTAKTVEITIKDNKPCYIRI